MKKIGRNDPCDCGSGRKYNRESNLVPFLKKFMLFSAHF